MIITCAKCSTCFNLDNSLVKKDGSKCRCTVCKHVFTAYPLPRDFDPDHGTSQPQAKSPLESEPREMEQTTEESSSLDFEDDLFEETSDFEMDDPDLSSKNFDPGIENPYLEIAETELDVDDSDFEIDETELEIDETELEIDETELEIDETELEIDETELEIDETELEIDETELEIDDDFSFGENSFDIKNDIPSPKHDIEKLQLELEDDEIKFRPIEEKQTSLAVEKETPMVSKDKDTIDQTEQSVVFEENFPKENDDLEEQTKPKEKPAAMDVEKEIKAPPKKERKVIVKPKPSVGAKAKPAVSAGPKSKPKKKKSHFRTLFLILLLILLLGIGGYIASVMTGYKLPAIDQFIKKPIPEISEVKPVPNQKSVNGRFVTNSTAGPLFIITGRVENPSNIAYSHIEIRGALITKNKEEAKTKNIFCGNIITEEMLKTGNISEINTLLTLKEGAHQTNVNVAPGASVPFMIVFSDLPEKLQNFTVKIADFDKADNKP
jgi:predicted Zn finger-like uncharacterized protein